jgi:hypothetical protein
MSDRNDEGILTSIFGPHIWEGSHCITFNYPHNPTEEDKQQYKAYFESLCNVLPCSKCRNHYKHNLYENEETKLTNKALESRESLTYWWFNFHKSVNKMLDINYDITYEDFCKRFESFIANCKLSPEEKAKVYKNYYNKEAPSISYELAIQFKDYAIRRGFIDFQVMGNCDKFSDEWIYRNEECWKIIKRMRLDAIKCLESSGEFTGLPTIDELHLIQLRCTTMTHKTTQKVIQKL